MESTNATNQGSILLFVDCLDLRHRKKEEEKEENGKQTSIEKKILEKRIVSNSLDPSLLLHRDAAPGDAQGGSSPS